MKELDFKKYKRFFAFGCSFTHHIYPTWANIIASEMPQAEFYNLARSGSGNQLISVRLDQLLNSITLDKDDLIMIMWSTFSREDRWVDGCWKGVGNVYNSNFYDKEFIKKYVDPVGYLIRDLSLISLTKKTLDNLNVDYCMMLSYSDILELEINSKFFYKNQNHENTLRLLKEKYKNLLDSIPITLIDYLKTFNGLSYTDNDREINDPHPNPLAYYKFLKQFDFPLTEKSYNYVTTSMEKIKDCKTKKDFTNNFDFELNATQQYNHRFLI